MHRGGIDDVPVLDTAQNAGEINLLGVGIGQGTVGQGGHELFQWFVKPAIESRAGHPGDRKLQRRSQDVGLVGSARGASRNDHGSYQRPEVQFTLPLKHPALHAQSLDILLGQNCLKHRSHVLARHVGSPRVPWLLRLLMHYLGE
jgi:hypothetical protein